MKPYNERLPMIDAAIEQLVGKFPPTAIGYSGRGYYAKGDAANILHKVNFGDVCTRQEFEQRAKELGWINGYKWGVEYETNGGKPNLPDDVVIEIECTEGVRNLGPRPVKYNNWAETKSFRIVDERYKPKEQDMKKDWYEKGELPPVGEVCLLISVGFTELNHEVEITYIGDGVGCYRLLKNNQEYTVNLGDARFVPLRTEMDKLVKQAMSLFSKTDATTDAKEGIEHAVTVLIEEGYRKTKLMSEQEFMKQCVDICGHGDVRLYRSGCRFIDQGD